MKYKRLSVETELQHTAQDEIVFFSVLFCNKKNISFFFRRRRREFFFMRQQQQ
jgi:hypothetical protein